MRARAFGEHVFPLVAATVMVLVVTACAIELRPDDGSSPIVAPHPQQSDPLARGLAQCRTVTVDQSDELAECRRLWAEGRRRFLRSDRSPDETGGKNPTLAVPPKIQDRLEPPGVERDQSGAR